MTWFPSTTFDPTKIETYVVSTGIVTPAAATTDIFTMFGSSTRIVEILSVRLIYNCSNYNTIADTCILNRKTAVNTGGTSTVITPQKLDSTNATPTITNCRIYTANPTGLGASSQIAFRQVLGKMSSPNSPKDAPYEVLFDAVLFGQPLILRGTSEGISVNFNGVLPSSTSPKIGIEVVYREVG